MAESLTAKDFVNDSEAKWCPGCGCFPILRSLTGAFANIGAPKEKQAIISGVGCSSRFPYYTDVYGFHTIHGRALTVATGLKLKRPDLSVWVVTGDGDALSIGGNHLVHTLRRNPDINILLFNNEVYGLTKGQASPTSKKGFISKTTPLGSLDKPVNATRLALASGATFIARVMDADIKGMREIFEAAAKHKGTAFIEIYFNCVIFNNGTFAPFTSPKVRPENTVKLIAGQPLIFGADREKGIRLNGLELEVVDMTTGDYSPQDLVTHDPKNEALTYLLTNLDYPEMPLPMGIFRQVEAPVYGQQVRDQQEKAKNQFGPGEYKALIYGTDSWTVE